MVPAGSTRLHEVRKECVVPPFGCQAVAKTRYQQGGECPVSLPSSAVHSTW